MKAHYDQFIGMYSDVFPEFYCDHMINEFERLRGSSIIQNRQQSEGAYKTTKQDEFAFLNLKNHCFSPFNNEGPLKIFFNGLQECFNHYVNEYDALKDVRISCSQVKMQRTDPGAGYHIWHYEQNNNSMANRSLVFSLYCNDIEEAGETEFLYQKLRIPPKQNSCVIWPAGFTHTHRGNVVHGNKPKYIITGWFYNE